MQNETSATIQLDKLVFSCTSTAVNNFDEAVKNNTDLYFFQPQFTYGNTTLTRTEDFSHRYKYSYVVSYENNKMGQIDFGKYEFTWQDRIRFTVDNPVFYNNTQHFLSYVLKDLNLQIENYTRIDIAIDSYKFNSEQVLRKNIRNKDNQVKIFHRIIRDRTKIIDEIVYNHKGSLNNPFKIRGILIKDKKKTKEYAVYNKLEEIKYSNKDYILEFHKTKNPNFKNIYRSESRYKYDAIKYYENKKLNKKITLNDLSVPEFLYTMFTYNLNSIIKIKDVCKREIQLCQCPI